MAYHPSIRDLEDRGLVRAMVLVAHHGLFPKLDTLKPFDRQFLSDVPEYWARAGHITWKQRRMARTILSRITRELERRRDLGTWIAEAQAA